MIRLSYFGDLNPFRHSSAGVPFFSMSTLDSNVYTIVRVLGFVEELVVHDDPEYDWSDSFRTSRKSNEYRQLLLYNLSFQVASLVGKKALELGGNAVIAYQQQFDIEGDSGIVARGYGTACWIESPNADDDDVFSGARLRKSTSVESIGDVERGISILPTVSGEITPIDTSPTHRNASRRGRRKKLGSFERRSHEEVQLLSMKSFSSCNVRIRFGGIVSAKSVKYLGKLATKLADQETRDSWWLELREEIRAHAKTLQCTHVVGYVETCTIHNDVCVLSAR